MATLVHPSLTNCQPLLASRAAVSQPGPIARAAAIIRLWHRRARERQELGALGERELRDMRVSSSDVWNEIRQPFWRAQPPC